MEKTRIFFGSYGAPEYPGAATKGTDPARAESWHVIVGGYQVSMTKETIGKHMPEFLRKAYEAGRDDERQRIVTNLIRADSAP